MLMAERRKQERMERSISGDGTMAVNTSRAGQEEKLAALAMMEAEHDHEEAEAEAAQAALQRTNSELVVAAIEAAASGLNPRPAMWSHG